MMNVHKNLIRAFVVMAISGLIASANALTPAGTLIRNQASATYEINSVLYTSTSNEVITEVLPVYDFDVLLNGYDVSDSTNPKATQSAYIGNYVYFQYEIRNYANTGDTINFDSLVVLGSSSAQWFQPSQIYLYEDRNGNGVVDPGESLLGTWNTSTSSWTVNQDLDGNGSPDIFVDMNTSVNFIISYLVPTSANPGDTAMVGVQATSHGDNTKKDPDGPNQDGGTTTSGRAFNFHRTIVTSDAAIAANKTASPTQVAQQDTITYTIDGRNVGGQTTQSVTIQYDNDEDGSPDGSFSGVIVKDGIDTSKIYVITGSISGSPSGQVLYFYDNDNDGTGYWQTDLPSSNDSTKIDSIAYVFPNMDPQQQFQLTFKVYVRSGLAPNTQIVNRATVIYGLNAGGTATTTTNDAIVTVSSSGAYIYDVVIGPYNNPGAAPGGDDNADTAAVDTIEAGACEIDTVTLRNDGNATDEFDISYTASGASYAVTVTFLQMDGVTPLPNDRIGPVAAGESVSFLVKVCVHDSANTQQTDKIIEVKATSVNGGSSVWNITKIVIDSVIGVGVDIGNRDGSAGSVDDNPDTVSANPNQCVQFPLDVLNTGGVSDVFKLTATPPNPNWQVTFYNDANDNGTLDADETTPITEIGPLAPGAEGHIIAVVCVPQYQTPNTYDVTFTATSTRDTTVSDNITDHVQVNTLCSVDIDPDRHSMGVRGGVVYYRHWVINRGNVSDYFNITVQSQRGWSYVVLDENGSLLPDNSRNGEPDVYLDPGDSAIIQIKVFIPQNASVGQPDIATVTATAETYGCSDYVTDITDVIAAAVSLNKYIMLDNDCNGTIDDSTFYSTGHPSGGYVSSCDTLIWYRVHFKNLSTETVDSVIIYEVIPSYTSLVINSLTGSAPAGNILFSYSTDGGVTWSAWSSSTTGWPTDGSITNIRFGVNTDGDSDIDSNDTLAPAESGYIEFKVKIE